MADLIEKPIYLGAPNGTFYEMESFEKFLGELNAKKVSGSRPGEKPQEGVWILPEGIGILYTSWREPERIAFSSKRVDRIRISAFGLESKLKEFESKVKDAVFRFDYERAMVEDYDLTAVRSKDGKSTFFV